MKVKKDVEGDGRVIVPHYLFGRWRNQFYWRRGTTTVTSTPQLGFWIRQE